MLPAFFDNFIKRNYVWWCLCRVKSLNVSSHLFLKQKKLRHVKKELNEHRLFIMWWSYILTSGSCFSFFNLMKTVISIWHILVTKDTHNRDEFMLMMIHSWCFMWRTLRTCVLKFEFLLFRCMVHYERVKCIF